MAIQILNACGILIAMAIADTVESAGDIGISNNWKRLARLCGVVVPII